MRIRNVVYRRQERGGAVGSDRNVRGGTRIAVSVFQHDREILRAVRARGIEIHGHFSVRGNNRSGIDAVHPNGSADFAVHFNRYGIRAR